MTPILRATSRQLPLAAIGGSATAQYLTRQWSLCNWKQPLSIFFIDRRYATRTGHSAIVFSFPITTGRTVHHASHVMLSLWTSWYQKNNMPTRAVRFSTCFYWLPSQRYLSNQGLDNRRWWMELTGIHLPIRWSTNEQAKLNSAQVSTNLDDN